MIIIVNNKPVEIGASERLNCIQAAERVGVEIPHYCWHPSLSVVASCRMCLVEVGEMKDGKPRHKGSGCTSTEVLPLPA